MKKIVLNLIALLGLVSCGTVSKPSSNESVIVSSIITNESTSETISDKDRIASFKEHLKTLKTNVKERSTTSVVSTYYLTDGEPFCITMKDVSTTNRYVNSDVGTIVVQKGAVSFLNEFTYGPSSKYEMQVFHDNRVFYQITDYESSSETDVKKTIAYDKNYEEQNFAIDFVEGEVANFEEGLKYLNNPLVTFELFGTEDEFVTDGEWTYAYTLSIYEEDSLTILAQQISYVNKLTMKNGQIVKTEQEYKNDVYVGGIKGNWMESTTVATYIIGEYDNFEGVRFNPSDYVS